PPAATPGGRDTPPSGRRDPADGDYMKAVVTDIEGSTIRVRIGKWRGTIGPKDYEWTKKKIADIARTGDLIEVKISKVDPKGTFTATLEQPPLIEGAIVAIDTHPGR